MMKCLFDTEARYMVCDALAGGSVQEVDTKSRAALTHLRVDLKSEPKANSGEDDPLAVPLEPAEREARWGIKHAHGYHNPPGRTSLQTIYP